MAANETTTPLNASLGSSLNASNTTDKAPKITMGNRLRGYFQLTKPTIVLLVVVTTLPSMFLTQKELPNAWLVFWTLLGTALGAGAAGLFNHLVEWDIDQLMSRTKARPIASGRIMRRNAFVLGMILATVAFFILHQLATPLAAWVQLVGLLFYVVFYTMYLKPRTPQNIVIGGAAGAVGPLIGWAAVTNSLGWPAWCLFLVIFLWTPPHFWALALKYKQDYAKADIPMYPVVYGEHKTKLAMLLYCLSLLPPIIALYAFSVAGLVYFVISLALTLYFVYLAWKLYRDHTSHYMMPLFIFSCFYLLGVFGALALDRLLASVL